MKKMILLLTFITTTIMLSGCVSNKFKIEMNPLFESKTEIYFQLDLFYDYEVEDYTYNIAKFDKDTSKLTLVDYDTPLDSSKISNYTEYDTFSYRRSGYHYEGTLNNPIFYNHNTEKFFDIRDNQEIESDVLCLNTISKNSTCNILDNDIQITVSSNLEINISNYMLKENLSKYTLSGYSVHDNLYTAITSYTNYDSNKIGIKVDISSADPFTEEYTIDDYIETIILEYDVDMNKVEELFRGPEYKSFDFVKSGDYYIFRGSNVLYTYGTENGLLNSTSNTSKANYLGNGYWYDDSGDPYYLFKYNSILQQDNRIDYDFITYNRSSGPIGYPLIFSGGFIFEEEWGYDGFKSTFSAYRIANLDTKTVIYEVSKYNTELVDYIVTYSRTE